MLTLIERIKEDNKNTDGEILKAINDNRFELLFRDGEPFGYYTYRFLRKNNRLWMYITDLYIEPDYRRKDNLLFLRDYMRKKVPKGCVVYWHSNRRDRYTYGENI